MLQLNASTLVHVHDFLPAASSARCGATSKAYSKAAAFHLTSNYIWTAERKEALTPSHYEEEYTYKERSYHGGTRTVT